MGAADVETITQQNAEMTSAKPRERQFQVVPMPGVFTRGRWKCWDYREVREEAAADKKEAHDASKEKEKCENGVPGNENGNATATVPINVPNITATNEAGMDTTSNYSTTSEMNFAVSADTVSNSESTPVKERDNRESSTILVTSIAPAPPTPQHGTPQSVSGSLEHYADSPITTMTHAQSESIISTKCAPPNIATAMDDIQNMEQNATASTQNQQQQQQQGQAPSVPVATSAPVQTQSTVTRQISSNESSCIADEDNDNSSTNATVATPNVAAIDNKIEQAMDLVKTHLTFAVREEVEVLRQTISELEQKVAALETENQQLRQYAPVEVVSQLSTLVQKLDSAPAPSAAGTLPMLSPPTVPAGFCSSSFATTLNNVVNSSL